MEEDSPQAVMLGLTSRATPIRRIRIQRGPGSLFTHTSNNAEGRVRFQKKSFYPTPKCLKFSNVLERSGVAARNAGRRNKFDGRAFHIMSKDRDPVEQDVQLDSLRRFET